jgi:hypothetical protein
MYKITLSNKITCVDLEQKLGLERGAVQQIKTPAGGSMEVTFSEEPTADQKAALEALLSKVIFTEGPE